MLGDSRYTNVTTIHPSHNNSNNYINNNNNYNYNNYSNNHMPSVSSNPNCVNNGSDKIIITDDDRAEEYDIKQEPEDQLSAHILDHQHYSVSVHQEDGGVGGVSAVGVGGNAPHVVGHRTLHNTDPPYNVNGMGFLINADVHLHHHNQQQQHNGHHTDYGKVSIASITGAITDTIGSDKGNISSLVNEDDVGEVGDQPIEMGEMVNTNLFPQMGPNDTTTINGIVYNSRGYEVCGQLNQHSKPCQRIGRCPFHGCKKPDMNISLVPHPSSAPGLQNDPQHPHQQQPQQHMSTPQHAFLQSPTPPHSQTHHVHNNSPQQPPAPAHNHTPEADHTPILNPPPPIKKAPYKQGWTKDEHVRFLNGLQIHGKGAWKEIAQIVGSRTPTQIQSHAQKEVKNKRSIHDLSLEALSEADSAIVGGMKNGHQNQNFHPPNSSVRTNISGLPYSSMMGPIPSQSNSYQNPQDPSTNQLGLLFSSFYRAPGVGSSSGASPSTVGSEPNGNSNNVPPLVPQPYPAHAGSTFRTQPPPPMAQPVFSNSSLHSSSILPHVAAPPHHNSLPPLSTNTPLSHTPSTPFPSMHGWFNNTFSSSPASKISLLPEFDDDDTSMLGMDDLHPSSNSVRNLISINDDDHPPLTHHLPHYSHDVEDDKLNFSSSYLSIPNIPRIDEDSNELPPLTGDAFGRRQIVRHRDG